MQHAPNVTLPRTVADALALWHNHQQVPAFRVESQGASQPDIWAAAFAYMDAAVISRRPDALSDRELAIALQLAENARDVKIVRRVNVGGHGYAKMVQINLAGGGEPIFVNKADVTKPTTPAAGDGANPGTLS